MPTRLVRLTAASSREPHCRATNPLGSRSAIGCLTMLALAASAVATLSGQAAPQTAGATEPPAVLRRRALWRASIAPPSSDSAAVVRRVEAGSPAERAGLRVGDRVVALNGTPIPSADAFWPAFRAFRGGDTVRARIRRAGAGGPSDSEVRFVLDSVDHEAIPGATVSYEALRSSRGYLVRTVVTRPAGAGPARLPAVLVIPWLSCDPVEKPDPGADGMARLLRDVAARSGMLVMRVEKPGVGDSQGPDCRIGGLEEELAVYRSALGALRARADVDTARIVLLGLSIGGGLAPLLAAESPAGIAGVISVGGFARTWYEHMLDIERRRLTLSGQPPSAVNVAMRGFGRFYTEYLIGRRTPAQVVAAHPDLRSLWYDEPGHQYGRAAAYYHAVQDLNVEGAWATLAARRVPALLVWGEYDWIMGRAEAERAVEIVNASRPGIATLAVLPKTDHGLMVFASRAAAFADEAPRYDGLPGRLVNEWLKRITDSRTSRGSSGR